MSRLLKSLQCADVGSLFLIGGGVRTQGECSGALKSDVTEKKQFPIYEELPVAVLGGFC